LKKEIVELFSHVRSTENGVILALEISGGLPFAMEIEDAAQDLDAARSR
jgi:hypothetical protein